MKITYIPEQGKQGKTIDKYGEFFSEGETRDIDAELAVKLLTCPYFVEAQESIEIADGVELLTKPAKRTRRTKAQIEADEQD